MTSLFKQIDKRDGMIAVLTHLGIAFQTSRAGWQKIKCPNGEGHAKGYDRNPSCSMRLDVGVLNCHSCGFKGDWANVAHTVLGWKVDKAIEELNLTQGGTAKYERQSEPTPDNPFLF